MCKDGQIGKGRRNCGDIAEDDRAFSSNDGYIENDWAEAPADMIFVAAVVNIDTAAQRPKPWSAPNGARNVRKLSATHWAAPVSFICRPRDMAAA